MTPVMEIRIWERNCNYWGEQGMKEFALWFVKSSCL